MLQALNKLCIVATSFTDGNVGAAPDPLMEVLEVIAPFWAYAFIIPQTDARLYHRVITSGCELSRASHEGSISSYCAMFMKVFAIAM